MNRLQKFGAVLESIARENELRESATVLRESQDFLESHREELLQRYPDQWIAVYKQEIVGVDKELRSLVRKLRISGTPLRYIALEMFRSKEIPVAL